MEVEIDEDAREAIAEEGRRQTKQWAESWRRNAIERLEAFESSTGQDVSEIIAAVEEVEWDKSAGAWSFDVDHPGASFVEFGTEPHEIEASRAEALAFEWPDAPADVRKEFSETFPTVFFERVEVNGTPAVAFMRKGQTAAIRDQTRQ